MQRPVRRHQCAIGTNSSLKLSLFSEGAGKLGGLLKVPTSLNNNGRWGSTKDFPIQRSQSQPSIVPSSTLSWQEEDAHYASPTDVTTDISEKSVLKVKRRLDGTGTDRGAGGKRQLWTSDYRPNLFGTNAQMEPTVLSNYRYSVKGAGKLGDLLKVPTSLNNNGRWGSTKDFPIQRSQSQPSIVPSSTLSWQ